MKREILEKVFSTLNIKKSTAARVLNVKDSTLSQKLKSEKKGYRLFDDEITLIIDKLIKEKIYGQENEDGATKIGRKQKIKELAESLERITQDYIIINIDEETQKLFDSKNYDSYIFKLIWKEQIIFNDIYINEQLNQTVELDKPKLQEQDNMKWNIENKKDEEELIADNITIEKKSNANKDKFSLLNKVNTYFKTPVLIILIFSTLLNILLAINYYNNISFDSNQTDKDIDSIENKQIGKDNGNLYDRLKLYSEFSGRSFEEGGFDPYLNHNKGLTTLANKIIDNSITSIEREIDYPFNMEPWVYVASKITNIYQNSPYIHDFTNLIQAAYVRNKYNKMIGIKGYSYTLVDAKVISHIVDEDGLPYAAIVRGTPKIVYEDSTDITGYLDIDYYPNLYLPSTYVFIYRHPVWHLFLASYE